MIEYIILVSITLICGLIYIKNKNSVLKFISFVLALFAGFRYDVGVDYPNYVYTFQKDIGYVVREKGFELFIDFLHRIGGTYQLMFFILAIIFQYFVYKVIEYYSVNFWLSLTIFLLIPPFFLASFNGVRQYIAIVLFLYSLRFLDTKKYFKYFITIFLGALLFHQSILFVMIVFPLINKKLTIKLKFILFCGLLIINFGLEFILSYTNYDRYLSLESEVEVSTFTYLLFFISFILIIIGNKFNDFKNKTLLLNFNFFSFLCLFLVMLQSQDVMIQMIMRLNNYFFFIYIILIPNLISSFKDYSTRFIISFFIVCVSLLYFFYTLSAKGLEYNLTPYEFNFKLLDVAKFG